MRIAIAPLLVISSAAWAQPTPGVAPILQPSTMAAPWNPAAFGATPQPAEAKALCEPALPAPAPLCETDGYETTIPAHGTITTDCRASNFLPKEIPGVLTVCGRVSSASFCTWSTTSPSAAPGLRLNEMVAAGI